MQVCEQCYSALVLNVEFLRVQTSLVSSAVFLLCLLYFQTEDILCNRDTVHLIRQGKLCPNTFCFSITFYRLTTVGTKWIPNPLRDNHGAHKNYQTEP